MRVLGLCAFLMPLPLLASQSTPTPSLMDEGHALFEQAQKLFQEKNYKAAKDTLNQLIDKRPVGDVLPKARLLLANLQEDFNDSIVQFQSLAKDYSQSPEGEEAQKDLGARYYLADKYDDAAKTYKKFMDQYPKSETMPEARYWYASSLLAQDKDQEAIEQYQAVLKDAPDSPWAPKAFLGIGNAYFKMEKYAEAEKQYLKILNQYHFYDELNLVYLKLGQAYEMEQKWKEAHAAYQSLIQQYPKAFEVEEARDRLRDLEAHHADLPHAPEAEAPEPTATPLVTEAQPTPAPVAAATPEEEVESGDELSKPFHVQVGVYSKKINVDKARKAILKAGYRSYVVSARQEGVPYTYYKVRVGNFTDRESAEKVARELSRKTREKAIVIED